MDHLPLVIVPKLTVALESVELTTSSSAAALPAVLVTDLIRLKLVPGV
jgi:hypothetical protein